jgi:hypothetical protein
VLSWLTMYQPEAEPLALRHAMVTDEGSITPQGLLGAVIHTVAVLAVRVEPGGLNRAAGIGRGAV